MPHYVVLRSNHQIKSGPRYVSSHEDSCPLLNGCLLTEPNLNPDLLIVLIRCRNIKLPFWQVLVALRYTDSKRNEHLCILRMTRLVFGVTPSPFVLVARIQRHLKQYETYKPQVVNKIRESLCVDEFISSTRSVEEAHHITTIAKQNWLLQVWSSANG